MKIHMQVLIAVGLGLKRNWHIFFGIIAGIIVGFFLHGHEHSTIFNVLTFIGQAFIRLIQMVVIPLVVSAVIIGIASIGDNIGALNERLKDATLDTDNQVHVAGGYQVLVSQDVIRANGKTFTEFISVLKEVVKAELGKDYHSLISMG